MNRLTNGPTKKKNILFLGDDDLDRKFSLNAELVPGDLQPDKLRRAQTLPNCIPKNNRSRLNGELIGDQTSFHDDSRFRGMTKAHYVDKSCRQRCSTCQKVFNLTTRPKHCRRCGDVYCLRCLQDKLRLNNQALPDPAGKPRKVCQRCFAKDSFDEGVTRSSTNYFFHERQLIKRDHSRQTSMKLIRQNIPKQKKVDITFECQRLLSGFEKAVRKSGYRKTLEEVRGLLKASSWQISPYWEDQSQRDTCRVCDGSLGVRKSMRSCKVCGTALCRDCSFKELLLFYDDGVTYDVTSSRVCPGWYSKGPRLVIINTKGSPSTEPEVSLLLHVCLDCKVAIAGKQVRDPNCFNAGDQSDFWAFLITMDTSLTALQSAVSTALSRCAEEYTDHPTTGLSENMVLVRSLLADVERQIRKLKALQPATLSQRTLLENYAKGKNSFYLEHRRWFLRMSRRHSENNTVAI